MPRLGFTDHAVDRYRERHAPGLSYHEAKMQLLNASAGAIRLRARTLLGHEQHLLPDLDVVVVTKLDRDEWVVVTVLPHLEGGVSQEQLDRIEAHEARLRLDAENARVELARAEERRQAMRAARQAARKALALPPPAVEVSKVAEEYALAKARNTTLTLELAIIGPIAKTTRHALTMIGNAAKVRAALKIAVRALVKNGDANAINRIMNVERGFLDDAFLEGAE